jgi:hypothetical protein
MDNVYKHIFLSGNVTTEKYKTSSKGGGQANIPVRNRVAHSAILLQKFDEIWAKKTKFKPTKRS